MRTKSLWALWVGVIAAGCGGGGHSGGGGGGGGTGNAAIDATLQPLFVSMSSGSSNLDPSITNGSVQNPLQQSASSSSNLVNVGAAQNDGTVTGVTVSGAVTPKSDGSVTTTLTVVEPTTNFQFLTVTEQANAPNYQVRVPQNGLAGLSSTGSGHAFVVVRVTRNATTTRTFQNTSSSGKTLVNFGTVTPTATNGTVTQSASGYQDFLVDYIITTGLTGNSAKINNIVAGSSQGTETRNGGPATSPLNQTYTTLSFAGISQPPLNSDAIIAVGSDSGITPNVLPNAAVSFDYTLSGGITGTTPESNINQNVQPNVQVSGSSVSYSGNLNGVSNVGDGMVQIDNVVRASSDESEDVTSGGSFQTSLDNNLPSFGNMKSVLYLPNSVFVSRAFYLIR